MHGLINKSIQCFVQDTYGTSKWLAIARDIGIEPDGFEAMLTYDTSLTLHLVQSAVRHLEKPEEMLLEDIGTYLVSHPNSEGIRRLLRFGGETFAEFLLSLDDLPDRARLAVPDLDLPELCLHEEGQGQFTLHLRSEYAGFAHAAVGVLRALADDYGALVFLESRSDDHDMMCVEIGLLDSTFAEGRRFSLARGATNQAG